VLNSALDHNRLVSF